MTIGQIKEKSDLDIRGIALNPKEEKMFLSKICIHTFGGYAGSQLRRMENKAVRHKMRHTF